MKGGFVPDDQITHLTQGGIAAVLAKHLIVIIADDFSEKEGIEFKTHSEKLSNETESSEAPMTFDTLAAEAFDGLAKESGVFLLFSKPEINQGSHVRIFLKVAVQVPRDQVSGAASIPELELFEGPDERFQARGIPFQIEGSFPAWLRPVFPVLFKMTYPIFDFHASTVACSHEENLKGKRILCEIRPRHPCVAFL